MAPTVLWMASPMMSHHTGMRPDGESVKLFGVWWKIDKVTSADIIKQVSMGVMSMDPYPSTTFSANSFRQDKSVTVHQLLSKAIDAALREGMTKEQINTMVNMRIVVTTMED